MLPDRVSNPGPLTYESGALPIALHGPARGWDGEANIICKSGLSFIIGDHVAMCTLQFNRHSYHSPQYSDFLFLIITRIIELLHSFVVSQDS